MKIVVDTSVIIAVIADEPEKPALVKATRGTELIAPIRCTGKLGMLFQQCLSERSLRWKKPRKP